MPVRGAVVKFSEDGKTIASGGLVRWVDPTGKRKPATVLADGVALGCEDLIAISDTDSGKLIFQLRDCGKSVAFSRNGRYLLSAPGSELHYQYSKGAGELWNYADNDNSPLLWNVAETKPIHHLALLKATVVDISPDKRHAVTGHNNGDIVLWDLEKNPDADEMQRDWVELADKCQQRALLAMRTLIAYGKSSAAFLKTRVGLKHLLGKEHILRRIGELDADANAAREAATEELTNLGVYAESLLRTALEDKPSLEARRRIERILQAIKGQERPPEETRHLRAVKVLESIGGDDAEQALESLSKGDSLSAVTQEANKALQRLRRRASR
jgi:hypothetical protein